MGLVSIPRRNQNSSKTTQSARNKQNGNVQDLKKILVQRKRRISLKVLTTFMEQTGLIDKLYNTQHRVKFSNLQSLQWRKVIS